MTYIRPEGRWLIRQLAAKTKNSEAEIEITLNRLIEHGHLRVLYGIGVGGRDEFQPIVIGEDTSHLRLGDEP